MTNCIQCDSSLYTDTIAGARNVRCANCGGLNLSTGTATSTTPNRDAWLSLCLGLASFFCAFLAGLPAVFLGIRALRKMRYQPTSNRAKYAALTGIATGGFIGTLLMSSFIAFVGIIVLGFLSVEKITDPMTVAQKNSEYATFESSNLINLKARETIQLYSYAQYHEWTDDQLDTHWLDDSDPRTVYHWQEKDRTVRIVSSKIPGWVAMNQIQIRQMLHDTHLIPGEKKEQLSSETLEWEFMNVKSEIVKAVFKETPKEEPDDESAKDLAKDSAAENPEVENDGSISRLQIDHYSTLITMKQDCFTMVFVHRPAETNCTEADIRAAFESFQLAKPADE